MNFNASLIKVTLFRLGNAIIIDNSAFHPISCQGERSGDNAELKKNSEVHAQ